MSESRATKSPRLPSVGWRQASARVAIIVLLGVTLAAACLPRARAQDGGVIAAGTVEREARSVQMSEGIYRRLNAVHEYLGAGELDEALSRLDAMRDLRLTPYEEALLEQAYGFIYAQQGDYASAVAAFERCLALDALPNIANQGMLYSLAGLYQNQDEFEKAVDTMRVWFGFAEEPVPADAYMVIGSSYAQLEQLDDALPYVEEAIERSESPNESWHMLALSIHFEQRNFEDAIALLRQMVVLWPGNARYWEMLASAYLELEDDANALATLMLAYKQGLIDEQAKLLNLIRLNVFLELPYDAAEILDTEIAAGRIEATQGNLELLLSAWTSAREYERAIAVIDRLAPLTDSGDYYLQKAQLLSEQANWSGVVDATVQALEKGSLATTGEVYVLKGIAHTELGQFEDALAAFGDARDYEDSARRNADAWIEYVRERRQVAQNRP